jgi:WXG100 family type VII secretion target
MSNDSFQANLDNLSSTALTFKTAGDTIQNAANSLSSALMYDLSSWDGKGQQQINTLGDNIVKNLNALANALDEVSTRLQTGATSIETTDTNNSNLFRHN